jgi:hypothetical protein
MYRFYLSIKTFFKKNLHYMCSFFFPFLTTIFLNHPLIQALLQRFCIFFKIISRNIHFYLCNLFSLSLVLSTFK